MGPLLLLGAISWYASSLTNTLVPALLAVAVIASSTPLAVAMHLLHAFPLVLLGMSAFQIERDPTASPSVSTAAAGLRGGLDTGVDELRRLVAGVMPATLLERGLYAAAEDFVSTLPIRTHLSMTGSRAQLPAAVESAAYFVLTEAVTNALKHAQAGELTVTLDRDGDQLHIAVSDDGIGGAHGAVSGGLTGLADRIGALGGSFDVESSPGHGTRLVAEVPCGSS
jgi:signal transduction histidine kinase